MPARDRQPSPVRAAVPACVLAAAAALATPAHALLEPGQGVLDFARAELVGTSTGPVRTLADYSGKILVMFQFGYNCPVCIVDGPSFQSQVVAHYQATAPDDVQVVGADMWNGTNAQVATFRNQTGATFPLLLQAGTAAAGNLNGWGPWDNYVIASPDGVVRFNAAAQGYAHGSRLDVPRMKALIDSLLASTVGVGDPGPLVPRPALAAGPNPFRGGLGVTFAHPGLDGAPLCIEVFDLSGRRVARLAEGIARGNETRADWDGRLDSGAEAPAGLYLIRARAGATAVTRRVARVR